jgi:hypothetical protein
MEATTKRFAQQTKPRAKRTRAASVACDTTSPSSSYRPLALPTNEENPTKGLWNKVRKNVVTEAGKPRTPVKELMTLYLYPPRKASENHSMMTENVILAQLERIHGARNSDYQRSKHMSNSDRHTEKMLFQREALRFDKDVMRSLDSLTVTADVDQNNAIDQDEFTTFYSALFRVCKVLSPKAYEDLLRHKGQDYDPMSDCLKEFNACTLDLDRDALSIEEFKLFAMKFVGTWTHFSKGEVVAFLLNVVAVLKEVNRKLMWKMETMGEGQPEDVSDEDEEREPNVQASPLDEISKNRQTGEKAQKPPKPKQDQEPVEEEGGAVVQRVGRPVVRNPVVVLRRGETQEEEPPVDEPAEMRARIEGRLQPSPAVVQEEASVDVVYVEEESVDELIEEELAILNEDGEQTDSPRSTRSPPIKQEVLRVEETKVVVEQKVKTIRELELPVPEATIKVFSRYTHDGSIFTVSLGPYGGSNPACRLSSEYKLPRGFGGGMLTPDPVPLSAKSTYLSSIGQLASSRSVSNAQLGERSRRPLDLSRYEGEHQYQHRHKPNAQEAEMKRQMLELEQRHRALQHARRPDWAALYGGLPTKSGGTRRARRGAGRGLLAAM